SPAGRPAPSGRRRPGSPPTTNPPAPLLRYTSAKPPRNPASLLARPDTRGPHYAAPPCTPPRPPRDTTAELRHYPASHLNRAHNKNPENSLPWDCLAPQPSDTTPLLPLHPSRRPGHSHNRHQG